MLITAIVLFIIAGIFGLIILTAIFKDKSTPKPLVFVHGPLAILALILVVIYMVKGHMDKLLIISVALFLLAALGGLTLFTIDMSKKPIPKLIAVVHPIIAIAALVMLLMYLLQY